MRVFIIHPGIQHSYRLANALQLSGLFSEIRLHTSILYQPNKSPFFKSFEKRVKPIHSEVIIKNHFIYELLSKITRRLYNQLVINPNKQVHNNPIYFWQFIFALWCLPNIWWHRKNLMLVTYETAAWPITFFAKKWKIPVVMDFPSISHEKAKELGINETNFGMAIKAKERLFIDYALFCSDFCRQSFVGLTSSRKDFVLYLGAEPRVESGKLNVESPKSEVRCPELEKRGDKIKISFIANLEYRKGLDILLEALYAYTYPTFLEVHLIGKIRKEWVSEHMPKTILNDQVTLVYEPAMSQQLLFTYLAQEQFDLNVQPSRFDSFAMVVPETMMQGIPNIVSPFVGSGEMFTDDLKQFIMKNNSASALNECLNNYLKINDSKRKEIKKLVLENANDMTWFKYEQKVKTVLKDILDDIISYKF